MNIDKGSPQTLFQSEHACVCYLFRKRWPTGFICPFCKRSQPHQAPAYTIVCRYCRKQTSITAHTVMHGSRNSLVSWMLVAWQFCIRDQGVSAREIQRLLELTSYQTAWRWLQKLRIAAGYAESAPCKRNVLFAIKPLFPLPLNKTVHTRVSVALEITRHPVIPKRVRFIVNRSGTTQDLPELVDALVHKDASLFLIDSNLMNANTLFRNYSQADSEQCACLESILAETVRWLSVLYRKAVDESYLQQYLDEFAFRKNTVHLTDKLEVFEHLLTGILSPDYPTAHLSLGPSPHLTCQEHGEP